MDFPALVGKPPGNAGNTVVAVIPSCSERYLSTRLLAEVSLENDSLDDLIKS